MYFFKKVSKLIFISIAAVLMVALVAGNAINSSEYGILELSQLAVLGAAALITAIKSTMLKKYFLQQSLHLILMLFAIAAVGRETSWGSVYGVADPVSDIIEYSAIVLLLGALLYALYKLRHYAITGRYSIVKAIYPQVVSYGTACFILIMIADFFEKKFLNISYNQLLEESFELCAYGVYLTLCVKTARWIAASTSNAEHDSTQKTIKQRTQKLKKVA